MPQRGTRAAPEPTPTDPIRFRADRGDARLRLDQVLMRHIRHISRLSRRQVQGWIESGAVRIEGRLVRRPSSRVREGAEVSVTIPAAAPRRVRPQPEERPLDVIHEDTSMIVLNKPPGMVVHPSYKQLSGTLLNALLWRLRDRADTQPGILTRLDKDTSGLVIVALDAEVHALLQRDAAAGRVRKEYLAVVRGLPHPRRGRIVLPLARDPRDRRRVIAAPGGADSETRYEVLAARRDAAGGGNDGSPGWMSLVRCELVTGRTHQIRVHLASSGWPILGDRTYGEPDPRLGRQALHAWRLTLPHPRTRDTLQLVAPLPADLAALCPGDAAWARVL